MKTIVCAAALAACVPAIAQYKCVGSDGRTSFQQAPCDPSQSGKKLDVRAGPATSPGERPLEIRAAIAARRPVVGMTQEELVRAIGRPDKINAAQYGAEFQNQLIYYREDRTWYVYTRDGLVTSIQDTDGSPRSAPAAVVTAEPQGRCGTASEIRDIEVDMSKIENRGNQVAQARLQKRLDAARGCKL